MAKKILHGKLLAVLVCGLILMQPSAQAFARDRDRDRSPHEREVIVTGHGRYHYRNGRFYRPGLFGFNFIVAAPPIGAIVSFLPNGYTTIVIGGIAYYHYDNIYYNRCPSGYVVVPAPVVVKTVHPATTQMQLLSGDTVVVNVPNFNGSFTPVTLTKHGTGYIGPQGEYYPEHPTVEQLKVLYGK